MSIRGLDSLAEIIDLLKNPSKFDAKMTELRGEISRYHEAIESVTKLADVNDYTLNIREKSKQVDLLLEKTKIDSVALMESIKQEAAKGKALAKETLDKIKLREEKLKESEEYLSARIKEIDSLNESLARKSDLLRAKEDALNVQSQELAERKQKLLAAIG